MTSYEPAVRCSTAVGPEPRDCIDVLLEMPATKDNQEFGLAGQPGVQVALPYQISNGKCAMSFDLKTFMEFLVLRG